MGSVIDYTRCPQCGGVYYRDFNYRSLEEFCACSRCGKTESLSIERDSDGNAILDEGGKPHYVEDSHFGFGAARIMKTTGIGTVLHFGEPVDKETNALFHEALHSNQDIDEANCYLTSWDSDKGDVIALFGEVPPLYSEEEDEECDSLSEKLSEKQEDSVQPQ